MNQSETMTDKQMGTTPLELCQLQFDLPKLIVLAKQSQQPIFVISNSILKQQYRKMKQFLPMVKPHFAIKALPLQAVVKTLKEEGSYFDVASNEEIEMLMNEGVMPHQIIHTHPIKQLTDIEFALSNGISTFVIDNEIELRKFIPFKDKVSLLLRLSFRNPRSQFDLSAKFGANPLDAIDLLMLAQQLDIKIKGCSFHVGSNSNNNEDYLRALSVCRQIYTKANDLNIILTTIDIGGGFSCNINRSLDEEASFFAPIATYLQTHFADCEIISEPGRYICAAAAILLCKVIGKNVRDGQICYYLNDGVYNNFSGLIFDKAHYPIYSQHCLNESNNIYHESKLFGPTCDNLDTICENIMLPELKTNDVIFATQIGAYSRANATHFNFLGETLIQIED